MRLFAVTGIVLLVLGVLSFVVPVPHKESRGMDLGGASVSITTKRSEMLPPAVGMVLCAAGAVLLIFGMRQGARTR